MIEALTIILYVVGIAVFIIAFFPLRHWGGYTDTPPREPTKYTLNPFQTPTSCIQKKPICRHPEFLCDGTLKHCNCHNPHMYHLTEEKKWTLEDCYEAEEELLP